MSIYAFSIDNRIYGIPVLRFILYAETLDGEGSGRMEGYGWPMFRDPQGTIKNIDMELGLTNSSQNNDFIHLLSILDDFGNTDFRTVSFLTPSGLITQKMYNASYQIEAKRFERNGITYWGTLPVKFRAEKAIE